MTARTTAHAHSSPPFSRRSSSSSSSSSTSINSNIPLDPSNYPNGNRSLSGISLRAFLLGTTLGLSISLTLYLLTRPDYPGTLQQFWRIPFFISALALFHFLEFFITARYNTSQTTVNSFLLTSNGWAYNAAHGSALAECFVTNLFWPRSSSSSWIGLGGVSLLVVLGLALTVLGQVVRSLAMVHAGANFNHHVQSQRKDGHVLVTEGVYSVLRHPSYFGFFWWGLGTQLVLGNLVCFFVYAAVLWRFFSTRIKREFFPPPFFLF